MDVIKIEELNDVNNTHVEVKKLYSLFKDWYLRVYQQNPDFYVTYYNDTKDLSHVDISTGHDSYPASSKPYVLYHFWAYLKRGNYMPGYVVALAMHVRHLHIQRATNSAAPGYYAEVANPDKTKYGNWTYLFWNDAQTLENLRVYYSAYPLLSDNKESTDKLKPKNFLVPIIVLIIISVGYFLYKKYMVADDYI